MAGGQERILRRRIKSVESTKKITRAMELISATRVVKAQDRAAAARPYSEQITSVILDLVQAGAAKDHPLLRDNPDANTAAFIVVTSDRGLCGGYNSSVIRMAEREIAARQAEGRDYSLIVVGTKGYLDDIPVTDVKRFEVELLDYFRARHSELVTEIRTTKDLPDAAEDVIKTFKAEFNPSVVAKPTVGDED